MVWRTHRKHGRGNAVRRVALYDQYVSDPSLSQVVSDGGAHAGTSDYNRIVCLLAQHSRKDYSSLLATQQ